MFRAGKTVVEVVDNQFMWKRLVEACWLLGITKKVILLMMFVVLFVS